MIAEELEFQISQYVDGTLSTAETKYVEALVQSDPNAMKVLLDYRKLNASLAGLPHKIDVKWDQFASRISAEIESAEMEVGDFVNDHATVNDPSSVSDPSGVAGRIGFGAAAWSTRWRIAAGVLIAGSAMLVTRHMMRSPAVSPSAAPESTMVVQGPGAELAAGAPAVEVSVGPSPALVRANATPRYAEGVIIDRTPSKVVILGQVSPKQPADAHLH